MNKLFLAVLFFAGTLNQAKSFGRFYDIDRSVDDWARTLEFFNKSFWQSVLDNEKALIARNQGEKGRNIALRCDDAGMQNYCFNSYSFSDGATNLVETDCNICNAKAVLAGKQSFVEWELHDFGKAKVERVLDEQGRWVFTLKIKAKAPLVISLDENNLLRITNHLMTTENSAEKEAAQTETATSSAVEETFLDRVHNRLYRKPLDDKKVAKEITQQSAPCFKVELVLPQGAKSIALDADYDKKTEPTPAAAEEEAVLCAVQDITKALEEGSVTVESSNIALVVEVAKVDGKEVAQVPAAEAEVKPAAMDADLANKVSAKMADLGSEQCHG